MSKNKGSQLQDEIGTIEIAAVVEGGVHQATSKRVNFDSKKCRATDVLDRGRCCVGAQAQSDIAQVSPAAPLKGSGSIPCSRLTKLSWPCSLGRATPAAGTWWLQGLRPPASLSGCLWSRPWRGLARPPEPPRRPQAVARPRGRAAASSWPRGGTPRPCTCARRLSHLEH